MKRLLKNCSSRNNDLLFVCALVVLFFSSLKGQKVANYVNNGSFENYFTSVIYKIPYYWGATDSTKYFGELLTSPSKVPKSGYTYQWPKAGKNFFITSPYSQFTNNNRGYPRNRLKQPLRAGKTYCISFYVSLSNESTHGIDAIGAYFGDSSMDTIKTCNSPIDYLTPQVINPVNNIIIDTLNWTPITGTFVANGTEKYMLIGNFKSDANTNLTFVNPTNLPANFADYSIDDVRCIEMDAPAYAGPDKLIKYGDSVYVGRESDYAIDPYCRWYQLPGMLPLDTTSGIWVKPAITTTYIVKQNIECGSEKIDTVVVSVSYVGIKELNRKKSELSLYPNPADDVLMVESVSSQLAEAASSYQIVNGLGQMIREEEINFKDDKAQIKTGDLPVGVYVLQLSLSNRYSTPLEATQIVNKRFVVSR